MISTFFDFCSGIGAGRLGLEQCGLKCVGHSDTSRLADTTYCTIHNTAEDKNYGNLKRLTGDKLPPFDLLIAGFPCQTFSVIGRKDGFDDDRGQIIFHIARLLRESRPKCFILENVKGLVTHDKGQTLKTILAELDSSGYDVIYKVISSLDCGVPQMRQRVYFIGIDKALGLNIANFKWPEPVPVPELSDYLIDTDNEISDISYGYFQRYLVNPTNINRHYSESDFLDEEYLVLDTRMNDMRLYRGKVPTLRAQRDGIYYVRDHKFHALTGYEALLLQGFPLEYAQRAKGIISDRHLLMQAGNAMTVNVIKMLGNSILKFLEGENTMADTWQEFEEECSSYLTRTYGKYATFIPFGQSDSTKPDVHVCLPHGNSFYIETKSSAAQCGQFVLIANDRTECFDYSPRNATPFFNATRTIMNYMNDRYEEFANAGSAGVEIPLSDNVFYDWIKTYYSQKGVRFFITYGNEYIIFPIEKFDKYFSVSCCYRMKRSGSTDPTRNNHAEINTLLSENGIPGTLRPLGKELYINSPRNLDGLILQGNTYRYLFKRGANSNYLIRRLSNTCNSNVIFQISLNKLRQDKEDLSVFINTIR